METFGCLIQLSVTVMIVTILVEIRRNVTKFLLYILAIKFFIPDLFLSRMMFIILTTVIVVLTFSAALDLEIKVIVFLINNILKSPSMNSEKN